MRLRGGGFPSIQFNSMNEPIVIKFSETAPVWRRIGYGLNLEGQCANLKCEAYHQKVWIVKGFGNFNITKEVNSSVCPMCQQKATDINNMGLYQGYCRSKGMVQGE